MNQPESSGATQRLAPLRPDDWNADVGAVRDMLPMDLNVYRTMAHHPALLQAWGPLRRQVVAETVLSRRELEIVTLRTAHRAGSHYEWSQHVQRGQLAGLTAREIATLAEARPGCLAEGDQALVAAVDELTGEYRLSDETWAKLKAGLGTIGVLQVIATVGFYVSLAYLIRSCDVQLERS